MFVAASEFSCGIFFQYSGADNIYACAICARLLRRTSGARATLSICLFTMHTLHPPPRVHCAGWWLCILLQLLLHDVVDIIDSEGVLLVMLTGLTAWSTICTVCWMSMLPTWNNLSNSGKRNLLRKLNELKRYFSVCCRGESVFPHELVLFRKIIVSILCLNETIICTC